MNCGECGNTTELKEIEWLKNSHDEMLEALEACKRWHQSDSWRIGTKDKHNRWQDHRNVIDNAIKKARGEA